MNARTSTKNTANYDRMVSTPVSRLIVRLCIPTILSMVITNLYNLVDAAFVGTLGNSASGAVGVVFGFMPILQAIGFMAGQGSGSIISRCLGKKDYDKAGIMASTAFFWAFFFSCLISLVCFVFIDTLVELLGSTPTIAPYAKTYISFILMTAPFAVTSFTLNNILRYEGKAFFGMIGLLSGAVLNIGGDMLFMFGLKMGIAGAGLSTAISQVVSFMILLFSFVTKKTVCTLSIKKASGSFKVVADIFTAGLPSLLRQALNSITGILLNVEAGRFGDEAVAGMSISSRIFFFMFAIAIGVGQGFQPVCGFNYGAGKYSRVRKAYRFTWGMSEVLMVIAGTAVFFASPSLVRLFRDDAVVQMIASRALRLQCIAVMFLPFCMATEMLLQCTGNKTGAAFVSSLRSGILFIPILLILAPLRGLSGIEEAQPLAYILSVLPVIPFALNFFRKLPAKDEGPVVQDKA